MKKLFLVLFITFLPLQFSFAVTPMATFDAGANLLLSATKADQAIAYAQQLYEYVETARRFEAQVQEWATATERYTKALGSFKDINDFSSFMNWYNRALEEEQNFQSTVFDNTITIGKKSYSIYELDQIGYDFAEDLKWDEEFTEEQRYEMWMNLGLTPANYAYVMPYRAKSAELTYEMMANRGWQDTWMARNIQSVYERQNTLANDQNKPIEDKLTEKELLMMQNEALNEQILTLQEISRQQALIIEDIAIRRKLDNAPPVIAPPIQQMPENAGFKPLY